MTEIEEAVAHLQMEMVALRHLVAMLLADHCINSPAAMEGVTRLFRGTTSLDLNAGVEEGARLQMHQIVQRAQAYIEAERGRLAAADFSD